MQNQTVNKISRESVVCLFFMYVFHKAMKTVTEH